MNALLVFSKKILQTCGCCLLYVVFEEINCLLFVIYKLGHTVAMSFHALIFLLQSLKGIYLILQYSNAVKSNTMYFVYLIKFYGLFWQQKIHRFHVIYIFMCGLNVITSLV